MIARLEAEGLVEVAEHSTLIARLREVHQVVDGDRDIATASLIENWIDEAERHAWSLFILISLGS